MSSSLFKVTPIHKTSKAKAPSIYVEISGQKNENKAFIEARKEAEKRTRLSDFNSWLFDPEFVKPLNN